tara:strand:+ start:60 stop:173 length:114 start_codon:yes stop_codon:yes gene_type:complete
MVAAAILVKIFMHYPLRSKKRKEKVTRTKVGFLRKVA